MSSVPSSPIFRAFEIEALRRMLAPEVDSSLVEAVLSEAVLVSYNYSGSGYFLTIAHTALPKERSVHSYPPVVGKAEGIEAGFVAFIQDGELMLECHTWGGIDVPPDFRDKDVAVSVLEDHEIVWVSRISAA